jgi:diguanylate cyclase (GGDEF)-like protein/excisionase family DNA binding protein
MNGQNPKYAASTHGTPDGAIDVRAEISRVLTERGDAIVSDSVGIFPYSGPQPLETDYCERLGRRLLVLIGASVEGRLAAEGDSLTELQRLVSDRSLPMQRLFTFVYLMERTVLDEIALDAGVGATSEPWPVVAQAVRKASFDLMAAYFERLQQEQASPTITDKLTTLYSRAMMDVVLSTEVQRAERFSFPMALMVFDVDKLSDINQRHGYGVGDRVLERMGILIRKFFRQNDWVFRHGEDSIAVLLCQVGPDDAFFLASRVIAMVEQRLGFKDHNTDDRVRVTVSAAAITGQGSLGEPFDAERLLLEADAALKRAKSLGRNRVERSAIAPTLLSVQSAAHYLQCSPAVVQKLISEGKLRATGTGHSLRIPKLAIEDYRSAKVLDIKRPGAGT